LNNTAIFYEKGCKDINIVANPMLYQKFVTIGAYFIDLNVGVCSKKKVELDFT
jgi:hypothetical protein